MRRGLADCPEGCLPCLSCWSAMSVFRRPVSRCWASTCSVCRRFLGACLFALAGFVSTSVMWRFFLATQTTLLSPACCMEWSSSSLSAMAPTRARSLALSVAGNDSVSTLALSLNLRSWSKAFLVSSSLRSISKGSATEDRLEVLLESEASFVPPPPPPPPFFLYSRRSFRPAISCPCSTSKALTASSTALYFAKAIPRKVPWAS
mmetsp:Transcript_1645/g.3145  ORF Transcript_1645/g.3145 Transcript_1645/m.3145 type:complete len:205 (-) Transcript_1645:916-1530(-)